MISASKPRWPPGGIGGYGGTGSPPKAGGWGVVPRLSYRPLGPLGLAGHAAGGVGPGVEPALGDLVAAVGALTVGVLVEAGQRGEHLVALAAGGVEDRLGPVGLGEHRPASAESCGYPEPATGPGPSPCRTAIDRSRSARISSRRLRATVVSTGFLASRPREVGSPGSPQSRAAGRADSEQLAGRPLVAGGSRGPTPHRLSRGLMRSGPLFRTELTAMDTGRDVRPPAIAGSIAA